jgi:cation diffusion facilitator family transporter
VTDYSRKSAVALLSVVSNTTLIALKLVVGLLSGSVSVISEAIHSGVDLLAALIALFAVRASGKPADEEHQFGHEKWENVSGLAEALLIFLAAAWIVLAAVRKLMHPEQLHAVGWGVGVMLASSGVNVVVSRALFKVGRETHSQALLADAWHLLTDVWTSAGVMAGLLCIWLGRLLYPAADLRWIDPVAALVVALLILKAAWDLTLSSGRDLIDTSLPPAERDWIGACIVGIVPQACGFHGLRTRKAGRRRFIELHLEVPQGMSVAESHRLTERIEEAIRLRYGDADVTVHVEPCGKECSQALCQMAEVQAGEGEQEHGGHS